MPRWIRDDTGRFVRRPYYDPGEIDRECEAIVEQHLQHRHGEVRYPITTDDLHVLVERQGARIDAFADLSNHGPDTEAVTEFFPDQPPLVSIAKELAADPRRENRLRTTLAHEFGHVHFHEPLYRELFRTSVGTDYPTLSTQGVFSRDDVPDAPRTDWMEWQAGYVCGAILMPVSALRRRLSAVTEDCTASSAVRVGTGGEWALISEVTTAFAVSGEAARIRLLKLGILRDRARDNAG